MTLNRDVVIIGGGPGGYVAAIRAAQLGGRVTLIEADEVGGTCLNYGCIPSKTLLHGVSTIKKIKKAVDFGVSFASDPEINLHRMVDRKNKVVAANVRGIHSLFKSWDIRFIKGRGSFLNERTILVSGQNGEDERLSADCIIIATGSRPGKPLMFPFDGQKIITSVEALSPKTIPARLIIIGAGIEGSEFGFIYQGLGSAVTFIEIKPRVLHTEDEDVSSILRREMKKNGMQLYLGYSIEKAFIRDHEVVAVLNNGQEVVADQMLVCTGRAPNSDGLGLEKAGVQVGDRGEVIVNEGMETSSPGIYAIGDLVARMMLAHVASTEGKVAAHNAMADQPMDKKMDYRVVPAGIFTIPEIGTVGLKEWEAQQAGIEIAVGKFPYQSLGRAHVIGDTTGFVKIISDSVEGKILGVHIVGTHASDMIHEAALAMRFNAKVDDLAEMTHAHPTFTEAMMEAAEDVHKMAIHLPKRSVS